MAVLNRQSRTALNEEISPETFNENKLQITRRCVFKLCLFKFRYDSEFSEIIYLCIRLWHYSFFSNK